MSNNILNDKNIDRRKQLQPTKTTILIKTMVITVTAETIATATASPPHQKQNHSNS
jgi:hypothetical protein